MPAIITHQVFGLQAYDRLKEVVGYTADERDAFLLGNIGPDPLFCLRMLPHIIPYRDIGALMHREHCARLLSSMHKHYIASPRASAHGALRAYALGFVGHYLLDSMTHPLVYAQQYALCNAGIEGLDRDHGCAETHTVIEANLDEYVLATKLGVSVSSFQPHKETLRCSERALLAISAAMPPVVHDAYDLPLLPTSLRSSVKIYRAVQRVLDSKRSGVRAKVDYAKLVVNQYRHIVMFTHSGELRESSEYANSSHLPWPHPFERGAFVTASFDDLYDAAMVRALTLMPRYAEAGFSASECEAIAGQVNFRGERER